MESLDKKTNPNLILKSAEGEEIVADRKIAKLSTFI